MATLIKINCQSQHKSNTLGKVNRVKSPLINSIQDLGGTFSLK